MEDSGHKRTPGPLEASRRLAEAAIERIAAPLVFAGHLDIDRAILLLKRGVVAAYYGTGKSKALLAAHVSKSERWFHQYLPHVRPRTNAGPAEREEVEGAEGQEGLGYRFMMNVLWEVARIYPEALEVSRLRALLMIEEWDMDDASLLGRLELYEAMKLIHIDGDARGGYRIRARSDRMLALPGDDRFEKVSERLCWLPALAEAHLRGDGDFGGMLAELSPAALGRARERLRQAFAEIMAEALVETNKSEDSTVTVRAVIAMGAVGERDGE